LPLAKVNVDPPDIDPVPDVPVKLIIIFCAGIVPVLTDEIRPYASVVIIGITVELPKVPAPGPVAGKLITPLLIDRFPFPELEDTTLAPVSYTPRPYMVLFTMTLPVENNPVNVPTAVMPDCDPVAILP
jgi:hypothetical protein